MSKLFPSLACLLLVVVLTGASSFLHAETIFTPIDQLIQSPKSYIDKFVSVSGYYSAWKNAPGSPPVSRSDWVLCDDHKNAIYCTGIIPQNPETGAPETYWKPITLLARVRLANDKPYLEVAEIKTLTATNEKMVSVAQILFSPVEMQQQYVSLLGVLAKGYGVKGERMYLIADPTGAIKLGRLPKLYPKGTILHVRGFVCNDENGLPMLDKIEILSVKLD